MRAGRRVAVGVGEEGKCCKAFFLFYVSVLFRLLFIFFIF